MTALGARARGVAAAILAAATALVLAGCAHLVMLHDPLTAGEHNDLGVAYESRGQLQLAREEYRKSLRLEPGQVRTRVNLGNVEAADGNWRAAEKSYRRALDDSPEDADAMNNLAIALTRNGGSRSEALALAERAVAAGGERDSVYRATLVEVRRAGR